MKNLIYEASATCGILHHVNGTPASYQGTYLMSEAIPDVSYYAIQSSIRLYSIQLIG